MTLLGLAAATFIVGVGAGYAVGVLQENWRPGVPHPTPGDKRPPKGAKP